eukprot:2404656-Rhodomonas_salina.1
MERSSPASMIACVRIVFATAVCQFSDNSSGTVALCFLLPEIADLVFEWTCVGRMFDEWIMEYVVHNPSFDPAQ